MVGAVTKNLEMGPFYRNSIRGLWLAYACQSLLLALLYFLVASKPRSVSREVIVICGLLQLVASIMIFLFTGSTTSVYLLAIAALFVLIGSVLWPTEEDVAAEKIRAAAAVMPPASQPAATPGKAATASPPSDPAP